MRISLGYLLLLIEGDKHIEELLNLHNQLTAVEKLEARGHLADYINYLLLHDFNKLVSILYRVDVSESKLKETLQQNPQIDAAILIANMLIARQEEKLKTKSEFSSDNTITEEDKW